MRELAKLAYTFGGWWIWFEVYGARFTIAHYPNYGEATVFVERCNTKDQQMVRDIYELGRYIRGYCLEAPFDDEVIFEEVKSAVRSGIKAQGSKDDG